MGSATDPVHTHPTSNRYAFRRKNVETGRFQTLLENASCDFLGLVHHERSPDWPNNLGACPTVCLGLPQFSGPPVTEVWMSTLSVHLPSGQWNLLRNEPGSPFWRSPNRRTRKHTAGYRYVRRLSTSARPGLRFRLRTSFAGVELLPPHYPRLRRAGTIPIVLCRPTSGSGGKPFVRKGHPAIFHDRLPSPHLRHGERGRS